MYSKNYKQNLKERANLLIKAKDNIEIQQLIVKQCDNSPLYFFNMLLWTFKPKAVGNEGEPTVNNLPFITYPFQDEFILELIKCIEESKENFTEKSREMGYSWMILGIAIWGFLFKGWSGLIGSYKENYVDEKGNMDSSFERLRYILDKLPEWIKPEDLICKYMSINSKRLGAEIGGDSGENFGTGGRRKWVFLDEFALWQNDAKAFRKTKDITNCRIFGGTPEGKFNIYGKVMTNNPEYTHLDIKKFILHWTQHPLKTQEWYEEQKKKRTKLDIAKELDISYDDSVTGAVYPSFMDKVKIKTVEYNPNFKTYTSWDFGRDMNVVLIWQKDFKFNKIILLEVFKKKDWDIEKFAGFITGRPTQGYDYTQEELNDIEYMSNFGSYTNHYGDPYNKDSKTTNAKKSISQLLAGLGIHLHNNNKGDKQSTLEDRIKHTELSLNRFIINETCYDFIESMIQSRYPPTKEQSVATTEKTKPIHDDNSHIRTACEYFIDYEPQEIAKMDTKPKEYLNRMTGKIINNQPSNLSNRFGLRR